MPEEQTDVHALRPIEAALRERFREAILSSRSGNEDLAVTVRKDDLRAVLRFLKFEQGFNALNDMFALDFFPLPEGRTQRFSIYYQLYKFPESLRVRVVIDADDEDPVPSIVSLYKSADWAEREIFDMFGIRFKGHPDLRRIYLPDDFDGFPLRKDFPLEGKVAWPSKK
jgi:NADH-quinone oxidoreductase subunit C